MAFAFALLLGSYPGDITPKGIYTFFNSVAEFLYSNNINFRTVIWILSTNLLFASIFVSDKIRKLFEVKINVSLGKYSMEIYMLHFAVLCSVSCWIFMEFIKFGLGYFKAMILTGVISGFFLGVLCKLMNSLCSKFNKVTTEIVNRIIEEGE